MSRSRDTADQINRVDSSAANATAITIDSSENVLVGTTSANSNNTGIGLTQDDVIYATRSGGRPLLLNRQTSDGDIAEFRKDGSTVGSIGTQYGFLGIGTQNTGVYFHPTVPAIVPCNPSSAFVNRDSAIDIGVSNVRFKDLYLSGGIQFDSRSNKLDDYEEGTWTPTLLAAASNPTVSYSIQTGYYTKVGRSVTVTCWMNTASVSGGSGGMLVGPLPFAVSSNSNGYSSTQNEYIGLQMPATSNSIFTRTNPAAVALSFEFQDMRAGVVNAAGGGASIGACANVTRLICVHTYFTDA